MTARVVASVEGEAVQETAVAGRPKRSAAWWRLRRAVGSQQVAPWVYAAALALWASSWDLRLSVLMSWMPIEPIWLCSFLVGACVVHRLGRPLTVSLRVVGPLALVVLAFLPGALRVDPEGYGPAKVQALVLVILPVVLAAMVLLDSAAARRAWVGMQLVLGGAVALATITTSHVNVLQPGRFTLATVNTVSTGRYVGVAAVALVLLVLFRPRRWWLAVPGIAICTGVLVQVGSRGPLLFALVAVFVVIVGARCMAGRRTVPMVISTVFMLAVWSYAVADGGEGGRRVTEALRAGLVDPTRQRLLGDAVDAGIAHPLGVGWGDFLDYSSTARSIANDQGVSYAHNAFAEAFSEGGVLAFLALLAIVVLASTRQWRASGLTSDGMALGTLVFWLLNAMVSSDLVGNRFMWISVICALTASIRGARVGADAPGGAPFDMPVHRESDTKV